MEVGTPSGPGIGASSGLRSAYPTASEVESIAHLAVKLARVHVVGAAKGVAVIKHLTLLAVARRFAVALRDTIAIRVFLHRLILDGLA